MLILVLANTPVDARVPLVSVPREGVSATDDRIVIHADAAALPIWVGFDSNRLIAAIESRLPPLIHEIREVHV